MMLEVDSILVVCVGNICRSPMGEYFFKEKFPKKNIASAGLGALVGEGADPKACQVMQDKSIDMSGHIAQQLNQDLVRRFDLILCMSSEQERYIKERYGFARGKTYRLGHWLDEDVADPYRHPLPVFENACSLIEQMVATWQDKIY